MDGGRLLAAIIDHAIDGIITIDNRGNVESINPAALELFGYQAEEVIGHNISMLMPEPDRGNHDGYLHNYQTTGHKKIIGIGREVMGLKKNGETFPFRLAVSEVWLKDKNIFTGFIHDLSREKAAEDMLKQHATELEHKVSERTRDLISLVSELEKAKAEVSKSLEKEIELNQLKSRFVSMASHEFRTPLSSVQLSASLIEKYSERPDDKANIIKHTNKIKSAVQLLTSILNDFLSLEKLEAGIVVMNKQYINLVELAEEITEEMQLICKKNQHIVYQHTGEIGHFTLDPNLLKNALVNLISNAIKYSGEDTLIEFTTCIDEEGCLISVKDNGIGIPEEDQVHLFEPFFRAHNTGNIPGTGLGLNIVKRYIELMAGQMEFESEVHKGTSFRVSFK
ncbi:PAS domain-containing sensor histidine kinase [Sphingobacterium multivorum]|uniref:Sensor protein FixL n=1 Tax=Sphingobacterium multivorum TaxID=28454 RepID=A0A2X2L6P7_SPHMU|nr:PAS domain-containing sensor histidine kinase [Sphingobacterium multivorum]QQT44840.1 PAS domain-containing sensor histidine kinase [Sphingobacterium multivorum]QRQ59593.1 PAS domain-containing sensor histidine kinase [Sphingobacterium multivorum]SPZ84890.1 Sensor protein fixL [Sphingobacterium multivorum]SUJ17785.1 Sensor protein fixL [Sphingobacterium multivorum]VXC98228.1 Sensor protein fixL [Sphingobacterium multivorum]